MLEPKLNASDEVLFSEFRSEDGSLLGPFVFPDWGIVNSSNVAETTELRGLLTSVKTAGERYRILSLGAAPGEWAIRAERAYRKMHPEGDYASISVEADLRHVELIYEFLSTHNCDLERNAIIFASIAPIDGWSFFPIIDQNDWGARVVSFAKDFSELKKSVVMSELDRASRPNGFKAVMAISTARLIDMIGDVDFLHCDIQGAEADIFESAINHITSRVGICCISIHSSDINRRLKNLFYGEGWVLDAEVDGHYVQGSYGEECHKDGILLLTNPRLRA